MAASFVLGGVAVLSGCGPTTDPVAKAAAATAAKRTARVTSSLSTRSMPLAESEGFGAVDFERAHSRTRHPAQGYGGHTWFAIGAGRVFYVSAGEGMWLRLRTRNVTELYDLLPALEHGARSVRIGGGSVNGRAVTHYRKAIAASSAPVDVWVGDDGVIRQLRAATSTDRQLGMVFTTWRLSDFGASVHIALPKASSVTTTSGG
jgi:hypothetical protein